MTQRVSTAYANMRPTHQNPAGLVIVMDPKIRAEEHRLLIEALATYARGSAKIYYHLACSLTDQQGHSRIDLSARFRNTELTGERMLRNSFIHILEWLGIRTKIDGFPEGFTPQADLIVRLGSDPRTMLKVHSPITPQRQRRYGR